MPTATDAQFAARFPDLTAATFVANQTDLANYVPAQNAFNTGMLTDIGRAMVYGPDVQESFFSRFMKSPLSRGDAVLSARFTEATSRAYDPLAPQADLFNGQRSSMISNVARKNLSRQIAVEVNDYWMKQFAQTEEMIGDAMAAIMSVSGVAYRDDMWVAAKEYFGGSTRSALAGQLKVLTNDPADAAFADEMVETLWNFGQNKFGYKSALYNPAGYNTKSNNTHIIMKKAVEYPAFKKLYAETFNPEFLRVNQTIDYVDDFPTPAGAPAGAGELLGMIVDSRAWSITPMPDTLTTEAFRNAARKSTAYFTTYEYAFQADPFFNIAYIFAPGA